MFFLNSNAFLMANRIKLCFSGFYANKPRAGNSENKLKIFQFSANILNMQSMGMGNLNLKVKRNFCIRWMVEDQ